MQKFQKISYIWISLCLAIAFGPSLVNMECNVCQQNGAACVNLTAYHLCFGGTKPHTNQLFVCQDGLECTDLPIICFQSSNRPASCGDTSSCGQCNENQKFACLSRTTFALCFGAPVPSNIKGKCPAAKVCDASRQEICVNAIHSDSIICDLDDPEKMSNS